MKLICPGCGSVASAETWINDALCRETMLAVVQLPPPLPKITLGYLSLFRPGQRALTWKKAKRLAGEIASLVATGHVQVQGKVSRPCPPRIWAAAMEQMTEQRDRLRLPMPNHNYLRQVAWDLADRDDAGREASSGKGRIYQSADTENPVVAMVGGMLNDVATQSNPAENEEMRMERQKIVSRMTSGKITPEEAAEEHEKLTKKYRT